MIQMKNNVLYLNEKIWILINALDPLLNDMISWHIGHFA